MNARERIALALDHHEADRVPYDLGGTNVSAITRHAYVAAMEYRQIDPGIKTYDIDPIQQIVTPSEENLVRLNVDTRRIGALRLPGFSWLEHAEDEYIRVKDFYQCEWDYRKGKDLYFNQATFPLEPFETLTEALPHMNEIDWDGYGKSLNEILAGQIGGLEPYCVVADRNTAGLTENSVRVRGYEKWYLDTVLDPAGVEALLERFAEDKIRYWDLLIDWAEEEGKAELIQVIGEADDLGSQDTTIIDPDQLRSMVIPRLKKVYSHIKKRLPHAQIMMHSCGAIRDIMDDLIEAGVEILNPVQYTAAGMGLEGLKKDFGDVLTFWGGGVDTQNILNKGTPQQVSDEVKKTLDILAPGGGFVFTPVHNIQVDVSPENFWAMWDTLQEYGKY